MDAMKIRYQQRHRQIVPRTQHALLFAIFTRSVFPGVGMNERECAVIDFAFPIEPDRTIGNAEIDDVNACSVRTHTKPQAKPNMLTMSRDITSLVPSHRTHLHPYLFASFYRYLLDHKALFPLFFSYQFHSSFYPSHQYPYFRNHSPLHSTTNFTPCRSLPIIHHLPQAL